MKTIKAKLIPTWFTKQNATLNIDPEINSQAIYEYLANLINSLDIFIPGFTLSGYSASKFNEDIAIHNFYYTQTNKALTDTQIKSILNEAELLAQDDSQPMPMATYNMGSLYITIIGES
jgi:hypothetical protein